MPLWIPRNCNTSKAASQLLSTNSKRNLWNSREVKDRTTSCSSPHWRVYTRSSWIRPPAAIWTSCYQSRPTARQFSTTWISITKSFSSSKRTVATRTSSMSARSLISTALFFPWFPKNKLTRRRSCCRRKTKGWRIWSGPSRAVAGSNLKWSSWIF